MGPPVLYAHFWLDGLMAPTTATRLTVGFLPN
jgi:hypothetical protein